MGTSGGVAGRERGYCLMIGGENEIVRHLDPIFAALAPGVGTAPRTFGRNRPAAPPSKATFIADRTVPDISSRWSITELNMASWRLMPKA